MSMAFTFDKLPVAARLGILIGVPVVVCGVLGWFILKDLKTLGLDPGLKPQFLAQKGDGKSALYAQIKALQTTKQALETEAKAEPLVAAEYNEALKVKKEAEDMLPRAAEKGELSQRIEELARQIPSNLGKIDLKSVSLSSADGPRGRSSGNAPLATTIRAEVTGDINGIIAFIDAIEKNTRFMQVNSASIRSGGVAAGGGKISLAPHSATIEIVTYIYSPPAAAGGAAE
jgi:hypothetical protein